MRTRRPLAGPAAFWLAVAALIVLGAALGACGPRRDCGERGLWSATHERCLRIVTVDPQGYYQPPSRQELER